MDQQQWLILRHVLRKVARSFKPLKRSRYSDYLVACFYFWAVLHERPMTWAVNPLFYNRSFDPRKTPSVSQLNRRVASDRFQLLLQRVHDRLVGDTRLRGLCLDGKPLCVSPVSQDRDARSGHVSGGMAKGYKLHAVVTSDGRIPAFSVLPLNVHEMPVARRLLATLPWGLTGTLVLADGNYDAHVLHKDVAARGGWLITRPRGRARHPVTRRQMGPARRTLIDLWNAAPQLMRRVYDYRRSVERRFGNLTALPGLLSGLPPTVRGLARVRRFTGAKLCLYHARLIARKVAKEPV